jgi:FKBP12-rapamycin complex-associated protein
VRSTIDAELTAMSGESYDRAYPLMVTVQKLTELEECIQYKLMPEHHSTIAQMWRERLKGTRANVDDWQQILMVRSLVLSPKEMRTSWLKFAALCRNEDKLPMAERVIDMLTSAYSHVKTQQQQPDAIKGDIVFARCKLLYAQRRESEAIQRLESLIRDQLERELKTVQVCGWVQSIRTLFRTPANWYK